MRVADGSEPGRSCPVFLSAHALGHHRGELFEAHGLAQGVVHPGREAALAVAFHGRGGEGDCWLTGSSSTIRMAGEPAGTASGTEARARRTPAARRERCRERCRAFREEEGVSSRQPHASGVGEQVTNVAQPCCRAAYGGRLG
jgi:hypothetical protein